MDTETYEARARKGFVEGLTCAQAVVGAFCEELGLEKSLALRLSSSFGGGFGRLREVCGAFSGLCMVAGLLRGYGENVSLEEKTAHYRLIQELAAEFKKVHGSIVCREILKLRQDAPTPPEPEPRTPKYYSTRPCERCVGTAAMLAEALLEKTKKG